MSEANKKKYESLIDEMFIKAAHWNVEYGFFLLRVTGIDHFKGDPLVVLHDDLKNGSATQAQIDSNKDFWVILINLFRLSQGERYEPSPLNTPFGAPEIVDYRAAAKQRLPKELNDEIAQMWKNGKSVEFASYVVGGYADAFSDFFSINPRYMRDPYFTVTEFYADNEAVGFKAHHSNGSMSMFRRTGTDAESINLSLGETVDYFVGDLSSMKREWLINGKPMYEAHLKGKYNRDGEWKPIVYTGDSKTPQEEAEKFSKNEQVQGVFFYMYTTGFPVIEFILKTRIELPEEKTKFTNGINLFRVSTDKDALRNEHIYDGWLRFEDLTEDGILKALDEIRLTIQGLTFAFDVEMTWQLKYRLINHTKGVNTPSEDDMKKSNELIDAVNKSKDRDSLMAAISWFNLGSRSDDPIIAFVCFYTAIEALARQLSEGKLDASSFYKTATTVIDDDEKIAKYNELYKNLYPGDIMKLMRDAYFEIHISLGQAMKNAFKSVYGTDHAAYKKMFNNKNGLVSLRGSIVHESYSEWNRKHYDDALNHLHEIHDIAYGFITRIALKTKRGEKIPRMSGRFRVGMDASHPMTTLVVSDIRILPNDTWKIKPEWV